MTAARLLSPAEVAPVPWRNGAGVTRELASVPGHWRLSVAELHADAPFSSYPGIDRAFLPLVDVVLVVDGARRSVPRGASTAFPGEADVNLELVDRGGPAVNLMTVRERCTGALRAWPRADWQEAEPSASGTFVDLGEVVVEVRVSAG